MWVIEYLMKEQISAIEVYKRLQLAYANMLDSLSRVRRWVWHIKGGWTSIRPQTAAIEGNKETVDALIRKNRQVTIDEIARMLDIGHNAVKMIESLGYRSTNASWYAEMVQ